MPKSKNNKNSLPNMMLYHMGYIGNLKNILNDGKLKPSSKTEIIEQSPGKTLPYVFFNAIPEDKIENFVGVGKATIAFVFDQKIILNKRFYTNTSHSMGNTKTSIRHKIQNKKDLNKTLYELYKQSLEMVTKIKSQFWVLSVFQEVFTRVEPRISEAKYIILQKKDKMLINTINNAYPNVTVLYPK